tara:strand:+ start:1520 stop:1708 length:189 start_codon:yes stop_codon:yes gene_type:complete
MKVGDLIEYDDGTVGIITSAPYSVFNGKVSVVNVLWQGSDKPSKMDTAAIRSGTVRLVNENR